MAINYVDSGLSKTSYRIVRNNKTIVDVADGVVTIKGSHKVVGAFGCNNATPQTSAVVNAAVHENDTSYGTNDVRALLNQIRAALIANGICN